MKDTDTLQITIERQSGDGWPVIAEYRPAGFQLASRKEGELRLGQGWQGELSEHPFMSLPDRATCLEWPWDPYPESRVLSTAAFAHRRQITGPDGRRKCDLP